MRKWYDGVECEWFGRANERTYLVADGDIYDTAVWVRLERVADTTSIDASPIIHYLLPRDGVVETVFGKWPAPVGILTALARREVSGRALRTLTHEAYWHTLCHSAALRAWVATTYPDYWKSIETAFPEMNTP